MLASYTKFLYRPKVNLAFHHA